MQFIYKFVAAQRDSYRSDTVEITEGYNFSQHETLRTVELYDNDRFLRGKYKATASPRQVTAETFLLTSSPGTG